MENNSTPLAQRRDGARKWPDMSHYGIHFGIVEMADGTVRLVMVDERGAWSNMATAMGFSQSRWFGLYTKASTKLDIPNFNRSFPAARVLTLTYEEIKSQIKPLILARQDSRLSQMAVGKRLSWHPTKDISTPPAPAQTQEDREEALEGLPRIDEKGSQETLTPQEALRQTILLGMNHLGQDVYESGDGQRFIRSGAEIISREHASDLNDPAFLRASADADFIYLARGLVSEIVAGKILHSDDFTRFMSAALGSDSQEDKSLVTKFHESIDLAMRERVADMDAGGRGAFTTAVMLHEGRPTFWREPGTLSTALPISVVMQSLVSARLASNQDTLNEPVIVIDCTNKAGSHSWTFDGSKQVSDGAIPKHDICLGGVFGVSIPGVSISGTRVTRTDSLKLLETLQKRSDDGLTVFVFTTDKAGVADSEFRRALSSIGNKYEISGLADITREMSGVGSTHHSRLIVVGKLRKAPDYSFSVSKQVPVIHDYDTLWNWSENIRALGFGEASFFGDDDRQNNRWQAPYIAASQTTEPETMIPRNLLGPVRKALARLVETTGMGIDEYVCEKLGWTTEQLEERLSSEQVDAVALGISAMEVGSGLAEADMTGIGKGRVTAALCLYARRKGVKVVFMTEKADLFSDFYRDVEDIGALAELGAPFIVNNDLIIRHDDTNKIVARSLSKEESKEAFECGEIPSNTNLIMATYSQFNREFSSSHESALERVNLNRAIRALESGAISPFQALQDARGALLFPDYFALSVSSASGAVAYETLVIANGSLDPLEISRARALIELLEMDSDALVKHLKTLVPVYDMTGLKQQWMHSGALDGALLVLDESHVAAGSSSNTGDNLNFLKDRSIGVCYSSATFAKSIANFRLYSKLFPDSLRVASIADTLDRGGEPIQEILSAMLAEDGRLIRREHDLSNLQFRVSADDGRRERNENWANAFAQTLAAMSSFSGQFQGKINGMNSALKKSLENAIAQSARAAGQQLKTKAAVKRAGSAFTGPKANVQYTNFSSRFYNLTRTFMMALSADHAADIAIASLKEGKKPVITVENTMESVLRELMADTILDNDEDGFDSAPMPEFGEEGFRLGRVVGFKDVLYKYVDAMFRATEVTTVKNKVVSRKTLNMATPELEELAKEIKAMISLMPDVPISPLDLVHQKIVAAGFSHDEISGRSLSLVMSEDGTHRICKIPKRSKHVLKRNFNAGKLDALTLSAAGSTGISLHAKRTFADTSQRILIELQPASDIARRLQFWGRVNRKDQVCTPIIQMVSSGLPAETRLIAMQNSHLRKMSANISGNADNSAINDSAPDILNKIGNEVCFRWMEANSSIARIIGFNLGDISDSKTSFSNTKFVDMLTGRMMMLTVDQQRRAYQEITAEFNSVIEQYEASGSNPLKSAEYDIGAKISRTDVMQVTSGVGSVFFSSVDIKELVFPISLPALDPEDIRNEIAAGANRIFSDYGSDYVSRQCEMVTELSDMMLPTMLPSRFSTVEQALADEGHNSIKNAVAKYEFLRNFIGKVTPGSILSFSSLSRISGGAGAGHEELSGDADDDDDILITGITIPEDNPLAMAGYKMQGFSVDKRKLVEISFPVLSSKASIWISADINGKDKEAYARLVGRFFEQVSTPIEGTATRVVLSGNLYKAAEIADASRQGSAITYSDNNGVWSHGILLPKTTSFENAKNFPVTVDNLETLQALKLYVETEELLRKAAKAFYEAAQNAERNARDESLRAQKKAKNTVDFGGPTGLPFDAPQEHEERNQPPLKIEVPEIYAHYINKKRMWSEVSAVLSDDFRHSEQSKHTYKIYIRGSGIEIDINAGIKDADKWIAHETIKPLVQSRDYELTSRTRFLFVVVAGSENLFLEKFLKVTEAQGIRVLLEGSYRDWYNNYLESQLGAPCNKATAIEHIVEEDAEEDLDDLLVKPSFNPVSSLI